MQYVRHPIDAADKTLARSQNATRDRRYRLKCTRVTHKYHIISHLVSATGKENPKKTHVLLHLVAREKRERRERHI
jgi:hypothetical protein